MAQEYVTPDFLNDSDEDVIHERMLSVIPDTIDKSEGGFVWDFTRPTAIEHARLKGFHMNEAIKLIWPQFATGVYLDYHGETRGVARKEGIRASGMLEVEVSSGTTIQSGDLFSTVAQNGVANVFFQSIQSYDFKEAGTYEIEVECTEVGIIGNVAVDTIILTGTPNSKIISVTNPEKFENGIDLEDDDSYRERLVEFDKSASSSYIGNVNDYTRWASEVNGVGNVKVIGAQDDSGTVTVIITDGNGNPASNELCESVYDHIMKPNNDLERLAPVNAILKVVPPETINIQISAVVELRSGNIDDISTEFLASMKEYFASSVSDKEIRYTYVCGLLGKMPGVYDYKDVYINGDQNNIPLDTDVMPVIELSSITLTEGVVV